MKLQNRVAVITGSANGIGRGIAERLVAEGAKVAIADVNFENAQKTAGEIGLSALAVQVDVSSRSSVEDMIEHVESRLGPIYVLVNNAGISEVKPFLELDDTTWHKHLNINLTGTFLCSQAVLKRMVCRKAGKIINISSQSGKKGNSQYEAYCASKFGIIGLTQSMAVEFASSGININAVCPGIVFTSLWDKMLPQYAAKRNMPPEKVKEYLISKIPMGRFCTPEDVGGVVAFLASRDGDYMTGQAMNLTGGAIMH